MVPQKVTVFLEHQFFLNPHDTGMSIEYQAHNMPNTSFAFVQSVLTTAPCTSGLGLHF